MARVPYTHNAYEAWIHNGQGYGNRIVLGNWFHKPTQEELCMVVPKGVKLESVKIDEMSVIQRDSSWYRVMRRPLEILGQRPNVPLANLKVHNHLVWPVPNEDGTRTGIFYVHRSETETLQILVLEGCTLKVTTINDRLTDDYALTCRESTYRRICDRYGLSRSESSNGASSPVGEVNSSVCGSEGRS